MRIYFHLVTIFSLSDVYDLVALPLWKARLLDTVISCVHRGASSLVCSYFEQEDILEELVKKGSAAGGGFALTSLISKGSKFGGLDIKRVYFGCVSTD